MYRQHVAICALCRSKLAAGAFHFRLFFVPIVYLTCFPFFRLLCFEQETSNSYIRHYSPHLRFPESAYVACIPTRSFLQTEITNAARATLKRKWKMTCKSDQERRRAFAPHAQGIIDIALPLLPGEGHPKCTTHKETGIRRYARQYIPVCFPTCARDILRSPWRAHEYGGSAPTMSNKANLGEVA